MYDTTRPTPELRFVERIEDRPYGKDEFVKPVRILQQSWSIEKYDDLGICVYVGKEWRDVPLVKEADA